MNFLKYGRLGAGHIPVLFAIVFTTMLGVTYCFAVYRGDVDPVFPYISASGDSRPESCIFSAFLNICSAISILIVNMRYSLVVELNRSSDLNLKLLNRIAYFVGLASAIGMFTVANFQETAVVQIHLTGAFVCFGMGCVYMLLQAWVTHIMSPTMCGKRMAHVRVVIAGFSAVAFVTAFVFGVMAANTFHKYHPDEPTPRPWNRKKHQEGYDLHCVSAVAEWTLALLHAVFLLTYSRDFEKIACHLRVMAVVGHLDQEPDWDGLDNILESP